MKIEEAVPFWKSIPESKWDMELYKNQCGTLGCALGHLTEFPDKEKLDLRSSVGTLSNPFNNWYRPPPVLLRFKGEYYEPSNFADLGEMIFEDLNWNKAKLLFRSVHEYERYSDHHIGTLSEKQVFFERLKQLGFIDGDACPCGQE